MKLELKEKYKSITQLNNIDLPDFTLLTGINGSGKSHLLEAILQRNIAVLELDNPQIVYFNYESFKLENEGAHSAHQITTEKNGAWNIFEGNILGTIRNFKNTIQNDYAAIKERISSEGINLWDVDGYPSLTTYKKQIKEFLLTNHHLKNNNNMNEPLYVLVKNIPYTVDEISKEEFLRKYTPLTYKNNFLPNAIGRIVWDYYVRYFENKTMFAMKLENNLENSSVSEKEFLIKNGEPPWLLINRILNKFSTVDYEIKSPLGDSPSGNYQLKLINKTNSGLEIDFGSLSSGEKVLMALVVSIYKATSDKHFPDILLLDEVDASLHPSMMKNLLNVIMDIFVEKNMKIILVTHSPSMVAIAPDECIYVMNKTGHERIEKKSKKEALTILTEGFATLDEGMMLFDEVAKNKINIFTEGYNSEIIKCALDLNGHSDVHVINGIEGISSKEKLKTLFDFISAIPHKNKAVFVWDCDAVEYKSLADKNNTYPYVFPKNVGNTLADKGIENSFPDELFSDFKGTFKDSYGVTKESFDKRRKKDFKDMVVKRNNKSDFIHFTGLMDMISVLKTP